MKLPFKRDSGKKGKAKFFQVVVEQNGLLHGRIHAKHDGVYTELFSGRIHANSKHQFDYEKEAGLLFRVRTDRTKLYVDAVTDIEGEGVYLWKEYLCVTLGKTAIEKVTIIGKDEK